MASCDFDDPPIGQERCHRRRQNVDGDRDDCAQRIQTDQAGEPVLEDARATWRHRQSRASVGPSQAESPRRHQFSIHPSANTDRRLPKHKVAIRDLAARFSLEMRGTTLARRFCENSSKHSSRRLRARPGRDPDPGRSSSAGDGQHPRSTTCRRWRSRRRRMERDTDEGD